MKLYSGYFSDKKSQRKRFVIIGYFGSFLHKILLVISNGWLGVLFAKMVERFGKSIRVAPKDAMVAESSFKKGIAFGLQRTFDKLGAVIGITISYLLITKSVVTDYKKVFSLATIPVGVGVVLLFFLKSDDKRKKVNIDLK